MPGFETKMVKESPATFCPPVIETGINAVSPSQIVSLPIIILWDFAWKPSKFKKKKLKQNKSLGLRYKLFIMYSFKVCYFYRLLDAFVIKISSLPYVTIPSEFFA